MSAGGGMSRQSSDLLSCGYLLTKRRPESARPPPYSICPEEASFFPDSWSFSWTKDSADERARNARALGIPEVAVGGLERWSDAQFSHAFGWPNIFYSEQSARDARTQLLADVPDIVILGVGADRDSAEGLLSALTPPPPTTGFGRVGAGGLFQCLSRRHPMSSGGTFLGFDIVRTMFGILCDPWRQGFDGDDSRLNAFGFLDSLEEARKVAEFVSNRRPEAPREWFPWAVVLYGDPAAR